MQFISLTDEVISAGKAALNEYLRAALCGPSWLAYYSDMQRQTGVHMIPGAIAACIEREIDTRDSIVNAVARATRCHRRNVGSVLDALSGDDARVHLWQESGGHFRMIANAQPRAAIAA